MLNWLLQQIDLAQRDLGEAKQDMTKCYYNGRINALKDVLKFIEDASRKENKE